MARITLHSKCRLCRTEGMKLYLKGDRCLSAKCPIEKKGAVPPGMHGIKSHRKPTDYGIQLRAKQKAKRIYGIQEKQFKNYFITAKKLKGLVGDNLLSLVERRLDNVVYLSGLSLSRSHAKQLISHKNILVNGKIINVPSYTVKVGDKVTLSKNITSKSGELLKISEKDFKTPIWMELNRPKYEVSVTTLPQKDDFNPSIDINLIIEYYSR